MMQLAQIRRCLEGWVPSALATCSADGSPNITYVSQVHYVDACHLALTFQFFNKTRRNILANPQTTLFVIDPVTTAQYRLALLYKRTEESGALFERMKAQLAGIASKTGMENVFRLRGADIYQVMDIEAVPSKLLSPPEPQRNLLFELRNSIDCISGALDLSELFERTLLKLTRQLGVDQAMILLPEANAQKLYAVATHGYSQSGIGSEVPMGYGVIGTAAKFLTPIRITHMASEYTYLHAMREYLHNEQDSAALETRIPFPGLPQPQSQMAVPILDGETLLGVIYVESLKDEYFHFEDEDALSCLAQFLAQMMVKLQTVECLGSSTLTTVEITKTNQNNVPDEFTNSDTAKTSLCVNTNNAEKPVLIRYFRQNHSVFIDQDYLIKGLAGAILWRLLQLHCGEGRNQFSNRELRLDQQLQMPDIDDNLEARLILLRRRLEERCNFMHIEKVGRGNFKLVLSSRIELIQMDGN
jgi:adenylate cyclase